MHLDINCSAQIHMTVSQDILRVNNVVKKNKEILYIRIGWNTCKYTLINKIKQVSINDLDSNINIWTKIYFHMVFFKDNL